MKKAGILFIGGIFAAATGFLIGEGIYYFNLPFSNRLIRWVVIGMCVGTFCHVYYTRASKIFFAPFISGAAVVLGWFLGKHITYTMVVWPVFGAVIGATVPYQMSVITRFKKLFLGFAGGFIGVHLFPFLFFGLFPWLGLPFIAWDIEKMGLILSGGTVAFGIALGGRKSE